MTHVYKVLKKHTCLLSNHFSKHFHASKLCTCYLIPKAHYKCNLLCGGKNQIAIKTSEVDRLLHWPQFLRAHPLPYIFIACFCSDSGSGHETCLSQGDVSRPDLKRGLKSTCIINFLPPGLLPSL